VWFHFSVRWTERGAHCHDLRLPLLTGRCCLLTGRLPCWPHVLRIGCCVLRWLVVGWA
jgi:hypothetical protein